MKLSGKENKFYTFMVIPHDSSGKTVSFRIPKILLNYLVVFSVFALAIFSISLIYSTFLSGRLVHYGFVVKREADTTKKLEGFVSDSSRIQMELQSILDQNNELRKLLGLKVNKNKIDFGYKSNEKKEQPYGLNFKLKKLNANLKTSLEYAKDEKYSLEELKARVKVIQERLAYAPSAWPIRGPIVSKFGYRRYPWRGMHTGIDIKASYGAPVRSTAGGVVVYVGWRTGYGKTVEISHGYGFKTLYAHNSNYTVSTGQRVKKGDVISYVGMTGYTTGPHLHYEVRKFNGPINPVAFLNLNILSAGRYF